MSPEHPSRAGIAQRPKRTNRFTRPPLIEVKDLTKRYGKKLALDSVSFSVAKGEIVGLLGPNGAGKSTTMRILTGFMPPTSGQATVAGFDVMRQPLEVKKRLGYLPETPPLYGEMRVCEYLAFAAALKQIPPSRRPAAVQKASALCGLDEMFRRRIEHLSKGYRQRVGLAQAIIHEPQFIILDEPTSGLDPQQVREVRALVQRLAADVTVLVSSHILSEVEATCHRVIIIHRGRLVAIASPSELRDKLRAGRQSILIEFSGPVPAVLQRLQTIPGLTAFQETERAERDGVARVAGRATFTTSADVRPALARLILESGASLLSLHEEQVSLEQAFIQLTGEDRHAPDAAHL